MEGRTAYLFHLLGWGLPVLLGQLVGLFFLYRGRVAAVMRAVLPPALLCTVWLTAADHLAISAGVWRFADSKNLGIKLGAVPLEEALFFLITNLLVAFGLALFSAPKPGGRRA
jgi:lycopene cyclase domain-containing protein